MSDAGRELESSIPAATKATPRGHWRQNLQDGLWAVSLANLCLISAWFSPLYDSDKGYYNKLRVELPTLLALATLLSSFALVIWLMARFRHRVRNRWATLALDLGFLLLLLPTLDFVRVECLHISEFQLVSFLRKPLAALGVLSFLAVLLWQHRRAVRITAVVAVLLSPLALSTFARILALSVGLQHLRQHSGEPTLPATVPVQQGAPRVLWVIFDETDQRVAFEKRPPGLRMPEFDRLRAECLAATNAYPPGDCTLLSMPGLISGRRFADARPKSASDLELVLPEDGSVTNWSQLLSVFQSARQLGFNTALVGWYHPYGRVLASGLNYCEWFPYPAYELVRGRTFKDSIKRELRSLTGALHFRLLFAELCRSSLAASLPVVTNQDYGLVMLHLPPPHKPGIYLPEQDEYTVFVMSKVKAYANNLMLADRMLGKLRQQLEATGQWDRTWLIISADHSWRQSNFYDGVRDLRVPFLVKAPGGRQPLIYAPRFNTVLTHDLILAILQGQLTNQSNLVAWLDIHASNDATLSNGAGND